MDPNQMVYNQPKYVVAGQPNAMQPDQRSDSQPLGSPPNQIYAQAYAQAYEAQPVAPSPESAPVKAVIPASCAGMSLQFSPSLPAELRNCLTQEEYSGTVEEINAIIGRKSQSFIVLLGLAAVCLVVFIIHVCTLSHNFGIFVAAGFGMVIFFGASFAAAGCSISRRLTEVNAYCSKLNSSCSWSVITDTVFAGYQTTYHNDHHRHHGHHGVHHHHHHHHAGAHTAHTRPVYDTKYYLIVEKAMV